MSVAELERRMKQCKSDQQCRDALEALFVAGGGTVTVQAGGKVFEDQAGGKVFIPNPR